MSKLLYIQILRAGAALSIAVLHAQHDTEALAARLGRPFERIDQFPWAAGVDVFFVISGFIMVYASRAMFASSGAQRTFLTRRMARIVPLYWTVTTLYLAVALASPALLNSEIIAPWPVIASYLFLPFERPDGLVQPVYSLGWTLNFEMYFYVLFALALVWPLRKAVPVLTAVLGALVVLGQAFRLPEPLAFWTSPLILEFAFGIWLGLLKAEGFVLPRPVRAALAAGALGLLLVSGSTGLPRVLAYGLPAALLVAAAALGVEREKAMAWPARIGVALGDASYALYLVHPFVIRAGRELALRTGLGAAIGPWGYLVLVVLGALLASVLVFRLFERPATELARRWLDRPRVPRLAPVDS